MVPQGADAVEAVAGGISLKPKNRKKRIPPATEACGAAAARDDKLFLVSVIGSAEAVRFRKNENCFERTP